MARNIDRNIEIEINYLKPKTINKMEEEDLKMRNINDNIKKIRTKEKNITKFIREIKPNFGYLRYREDFDMFFEIYGFLSQYERSGNYSQVHLDDFILKLSMLADIYKSRFSNKKYITKYYRNTLNHEFNGFANLISCKKIKDCKYSVEEFEENCRRVLMYLFNIN